MVLSSIFSQIRTFCFNCRPFPAPMGALCQGCLAWFADLSHLVCWVVLTARELLFVVYCVGFAEWCLNCHVCRVRLAEGSVGFDKSWGCLVRFRFAGLGLLDCVCLDRFTG